MRQTYINNMSPCHRKAWTKQEDQMLKSLYIDKDIKKWFKISQIMNSKFEQVSRTGKRCRERYHNHLDNSIKKTMWERQEEEILIKLHNQLGNSWAAISKSLPGRSVNCVKNYFYKILRKGVKILNQPSKTTTKSRNRQKNCVIKFNYFGLVEAAQEHYKQNINRDIKGKITLQLKARLLELGKIKHYVTQSDEKQKQIKYILELVQQINHRQIKIQKNTIAESQWREEQDLISLPLIDICSQLNQLYLREINQENHVANKPIQDQMIQNNMASQSSGIYISDPFYNQKELHSIESLKQSKQKAKDTNCIQFRYPNIQFTQGSQSLVTQQLFDQLLNQLSHQKVKNQNI